MAFHHSFKEMRLIISAFLVVLGATIGFAQPMDGLIAYYNFDACDASESTGLGTDGIIVGNATCGCGVSGSGLRFDGNTSIQILSNIDLIFSSDFTISFFVMPDPAGNAIMDIMSKSEICGIDSTLELR